MARLTWDEIVEQYPDQWVGLTEVEWVPDNRSSILSAVVSYTDTPRNVLTRMMLEDKIVARYTTPDHVFQLGALL